MHYYHICRRWQMFVVLVPFLVKFFLLKDSVCSMQEFVVAVGVRGATLQHRVVPSSLSWYDQVGFLD